MWASTKPDVHFRVPSDVQRLQHSASLVETRLVYTQDKTVDTFPV